MELRHQADLARRWWWVILLCSLALGAVGAGQQLAKPTQYASRVTMFMSSNRSQNIVASQSSTLAMQQIASYSKLVGTGKLAGEVAKDAGVDVPASTLAHGMVATVSKDTVLLTVTTTLDDKAEARTISTQLPATLTRVVQELDGEAAKDDFKVTFTTVDGPSVGSTRSTPKLILSALLGLLLGAALGLALATLLTRLVKGLRTPDELGKLTDAALLGVLPATTGDDRRNAVRRLATAIANPRAGRHLITVVGVDHVPTEVADELAEALAANGDRVLLVSPNGRGADVRGSQPVPAGRDELFVLGADAMPHTTRALHEWTQGELASSFDRVVIAAGDATDADALAQASGSDSTVLVARHHATRRDAVVRARQGLSAAGVDEVVAVMDAATGRMAAPDQTGIVANLSPAARPSRAS